MIQIISEPTEIVEYGRIFIDMFEEIIIAPLNCLSLAPNIFKIPNIIPNSSEYPFSRLPIPKPHKKSHNKPNKSVN